MTVAVKLTNNNNPCGDTNTTNVELSHNIIAFLRAVRTKEKEKSV